MQRPFARNSAALLLAALALAMAPAGAAHALCTCMIRRQPPRRLPVPETPLVSDASLVVLMREGRRTVLTMRVDYQGPPEGFTMLVPVPEVLGRDQVRTLEPGVVERLDRLSAPRLVEYWERNPCGDRVVTGRGPRRARAAGLGGGGLGAVAEAAPRPQPVRIEAQYAVDEYDVTILSAGDSAGLIGWLDGQGYALPAGAEPILRSYIEQGTKFFLARVDGSRLRLSGGRGRLAPLQFHYESDAFQLPIRLGLLNSPGKQDVVVLALSHRGRVAVANRPNAIVPTNLTLPEDARDVFPSFYDGLLEQVLADRPGAVVTEFAADVDGELAAADARRLSAELLPSRDPTGFTLTRLHYRYRDDQRPDDLVFRAADPIGGGDAQPTASGDLGPVRAEPRLASSFRARYAILHRFEGPLTCAQPVRGRWGGPRPGEAPAATPADITPAAARDARALARLLGDQARALGLDTDAKPPPVVAAGTPKDVVSSGAKPETLAAPASAGTPPAASTGGCGCGLGRPPRSSVPAALLVVIGLAAWRRLSRAGSSRARRSDPRARASRS